MSFQIRAGRKFEDYMKSLRTLHNRILDAVPGFEHFHPDFVISRALFSDIKKGRSYATMYTMISSTAHAASVIVGLPLVDLPYVLPNTNMLLIKIEILAISILFIHAYKLIRPVVPELSGKAAFPWRFVRMRIEYCAHIIQSKCEKYGSFRLQNAIQRWD